MVDWRLTTVAPDATHHQIHGRALYEERFLDVLKFHAPGLAPVLGEQGAYHIDVSGRAAYAARFRRTFGFYEGRAAVVAAEGWHHIEPDGTPVYAERHAWCGNYQGGRCAVRDRDGRYLHLDERGRAACAERWRYAGDYRDGIAVVQREDGLHTHVDRDGRPTHGVWFLDLDVFHKGFARARVEDGWTHVDPMGVPIYERRFAMVEPFYNGQARIERDDGGLCVIDERGETIVELRAQARAIGPQKRGDANSPNQLPHGLLATLHALADAGAAALLIRHADRRPLPPGLEDREAEISEEGEARAVSLGRALRARRGFWVETSPLPRCRRTAERILDGAAATVAIADNTLLGDPGPFVVDPRGGVLFASLGTERIVRGQIAGEIWPPLRPTAEGVRLLVNDLARRLRVRGGTGLCVSHDTIVMPMIAALTGDRFEDTWLDPLDGVALALDERGRIRAIWRGASVEIDA